VVEFDPPVTETPAVEPEPVPSVLGTTAPALPAAVEPPGAAGESAALALSIRGLIDDSRPVPQPAGRGGFAAVALGFMLADCAALAALHRQGRRIFSG
jgi:hypothetical protein